MDWFFPHHHGFSGCCLRYQGLATAHSYHWNSWDFFRGWLFVSTKLRLREGSRWRASASGVAVNAKSSGEALTPPHCFAFYRTHV